MLVNISGYFKFHIFWTSNCKETFLVSTIRTSTNHCITKRTSIRSSLYVGDWHDPPECRWSQSPRVRSVGSSAPTHPAQLRTPRRLCAVPTALCLATWREERPPDRDDDHASFRWLRWKVRRQSPHDRGLGSPRFSDWDLRQQSITSSSIMLCPSKQLLLVKSIKLTFWIFNKKNSSMVPLRTAETYRDWKTAT